MRVRVYVRVGEKAIADVYVKVRLGIFVGVALNGIVLVGVYVRVAEGVWVRIPVRVRVGMPVGVGEDPAVNVAVSMIVAAPEGVPVSMEVRAGEGVTASDPFRVMVGTGVCSLASSVPKRLPTGRAAGISERRSIQMLLLTWGISRGLSSAL